MKVSQAMSWTPTTQFDHQGEQTFMSFMHEFKQFVDDRLQKFPMSLQKSWILADDIHDVAGNHGFVVFTTNHLGEPKQFFDKVHEEPFLRFFV
jgi:hypothetical protein